MNNWLVGFLEGEGSFCIVHHKETRGPKQHHYKQACISFNSTDKDVAHRAARFLGNKCIGPYGPYLAHAKPTYSCKLLGARAIRLMRMLRPHMGKRRQGQITKVLRTVPMGSTNA